MVSSNDNAILFFWVLIFVLYSNSPGGSAIAIGYLERQGNECHLQFCQRLQIGESLDDDHAAFEENFVDCRKLLDITNVRNRRRFDAEHSHLFFNAPLCQIGTDARQLIAI